MSKIKFSVGSVLRGYKTVEIFIGDAQIEYKILRNALKPVDRSQKIRADVRETWLDDLNALNIFAWKTFYRGDESSDGVEWSLTATDGKTIYRGHGSNAYPDAWDEFLSLLDEMAPELNFIRGERIDGIELSLWRNTDAGVEIFERLTLTRGDETLTITKNSSRHEYRLGTDGTKNFLDVCQKYFDALEVQRVEDSRTEIHGRLSRHDGTATEFGTDFSERGLTGIVRFANEIHTFAADLTAEIFSPAIVHVGNDSDKIIFCKVQFKGSFKSYTYRTDDETLAVGDIVDVPVGRNNDTTQARIVEIGYFDAAEAPYPIEKVKTVIGRHVADAWENF